MNNITSTNIHSFCRTCLAELRKYGSTLNMDGVYNVHESKELSQWILNCLPMSLLKDNVCLPNFVCTGCYEKLQCFYEFRVMCARSMRTLLQILDLPENREVENQTLDWNGTLSNEHEATRSRKSSTERTKKSEDIDDKSLVMQTIMESGQFEPEINIVEQNSQFAHNFVDATMSEMPINNEQFLEDAVDRLDISSNKKSTTKQLKNTKLQCKERKRSYASQSQNQSSSNNKKSEQKEITKKTNINDAVDNDLKSDSDSNDRVSNASNEQQIVKAKKTTHALKTTKSSKKKKYSVQSSPTCPIKKRFIYKCKECNRSHASEEARDAHMRTHQGLRPFACTKCPKSFKLAQHLKSHMITSHTEKREAIVCTVEGCGKSFRMDIYYRKHYRLKHSETPPQWKTYICEDCGRVLKTATALREHRYTHGPREEYPYHCEQCDKRYASRRHYREHLIRHTGVKRFACPYCGMRKTTRNELKTHVNYHTKEKQWPCPLCPSVLNSSSSLKRHNRNVHIGLREHSCRYCNESFAKPDTLRHHEMRHTGEKPHGCHICHKRFIKFGALKTHMKTHAKSGITPEIPTQPRQRQQHQQIEPMIQQHQSEIQHPHQLPPQEQVQQLESSCPERVGYTI